MASGPDATLGVGKEIEGSTALKAHHQVPAKVCHLSLEEGMTHI